MKPKRAPKGSIDSGLNLRLPREVHEAVKAAALKDGLSAAEWVRRAVAAAL